MLYNALPKQCKEEYDKTKSWDKAIAKAYPNQRERLKENIKTICLATYMRIGKSLDEEMKSYHIMFGEGGCMRKEIELDRKKRTNGYI